jgi:MoaA/NifB/PqqE/SkfB family radical SAM enzyme
MRDDMKIAHLNDLDFVEKIKAFNGKCTCEKFHLRKMLPTETINFAKFNIEFSLACQGNCAMCCVEAPSWHGNYDYYDKLAKLVEAFTPSSLFVQGGEVLVQTKTLSWLKTIKETYPDTRITIITNGNVDVKLLEQVEEIFSGIYISFVGFQPATYKRIMGMDVEKAKRFAENLIARKKIRKVILKYLTTPSNIHEASVFLEWSISLSPTSCLFQDSNIFQYINLRTNDGYWHKIFERTSQELKTVILKNKTHFLSSKMTVSFDSYCRDIFKIDDAFIQENGVENIVSWHK